MVENWCCSCAVNSMQEFWSVKGRNCGVEEVTMTKCFNLGYASSWIATFIASVKMTLMWMSRFHIIEARSRYSYATHLRASPIGRTLVLFNDAWHLPCHEDAFALHNCLLGPPDCYYCPPEWVKQARAYLLAYCHHSWCCAKSVSLELKPGPMAFDVQTITRSWHYFCCTEFRKVWKCTPRTMGQSFQHEVVVCQQYTPPVILLYNVMSNLGDVEHSN